MRGDIIAVESPTFFGVSRLIEKIGHARAENRYRLQTSLDLDALGAAFDTMDIKALLASPNISNVHWCL